MIIYQTKPSQAPFPLSFQEPYKKGMRKNGNQQSLYYDNL